MTFGGHHTHVADDHKVPGNDADSLEDTLGGSSKEDQVVAEAKIVKLTPMALLSDPVAEHLRDSAWQRGHPLPPGHWAAQAMMRYPL